MNGESHRRALLDAAVEALADERRRHLVVALDRHDGSDGWVDVSRVAPETATTADAGVELRHAHLPKLASGGFIEWDRADGRVRPGPCFETVARLAEAISTAEIETSAAAEAQAVSCSERSR